MIGMLLRRHKLTVDRELLGRWGEKRSGRFLKKKGLKVLTRNFSCKCGEIDLIMVDRDGSIVFVEVRTRAGEDFATAEASITSVKKARLLKTARFFLAKHRIEDRPFRFDVVTIVLGQSGGEQIRHYKNAFVP
jgi:putative endonuclease